ncbi:hypothetical protein [uncultured Brachyspira sp.]|uniref:hypothetical protein n=1 Tax=uncultured Brachyspira sp. TaxID=221953 RepID=UPI0025D9B8D8|nr:hypothetical protein [uncultured Brachyspira sp.]
MKKILKLTLVLSIFAVLTISCQKIKTYGLVGTYKTDDGKFIMKVSQEGNASISLANSSEDVTKLTASQRAFVKSLITSRYDSSDRLNDYSSGNDFTLEPWDLTEEKAAQTFEVKVKAASGINFDPSNPYNSTANAYEDVAYKAEFTKDKETYTCKVTISIPDAVKNINNKYLPYGGGSGGGQNTPQDKSAGYQIDNGGEMTFKK